MTRGIVSTMTREDELCLLLARGQLTPKERTRSLEFLASPLQWPEIMERAYAHEVYPLLYRSLRDISFPGVPESVQAELKSLYLANAFRNQLLAEELARLLGVLGEAGIWVVPLKGVTLAQSLYGDPAARVCSDIDILVPPADVVRARRLILGNGYSSRFSEEFFVKHQLHTTADCSLIAQRPPLTCLVEVHWTLLPDSSEDAGAVSELWARAHPANFVGVEAWDLSPEWQFLYLSVHAAHHKWNKLKWLADIHELCMTRPLDWPQVKQDAERYELEAVAGPTLTACARLFETPVPEEFSSGSFPADVLLFPDSLDPAESWKQTLFYPRLLKRRSEKLRWLAQTLFVPKMADHRFVSLPSSLTFLYYVMRPMRLSFKWSWRLLRAGVARLTRSSL